MFTPPLKVDPGAIWTKSPTTQSWSTEECVFIIAFLPILVPGFTVTPAAIKVPSPIFTSLATTDPGWTTTGDLKPISFSFRYILFLLPQSPIEPIPINAYFTPLLNTFGRASSAPITLTPKTDEPIGNSGSTIPWILNMPADLIASITTFPCPPPPMMTIFSFVFAILLCLT